MAAVALVAAMTAMAAVARKGILDVDQNG